MTARQVPALPAMPCTSSSTGAPSLGSGPVMRYATS